MAVTTQNSTQYANTVATPVVNNATADLHGRLRTAYVTTAQSGAGDATSSVALFKLPAGKVRLNIAKSYLYVNWTTASATLDLGWDAYTGQDGVAVAADPNGLANAIDVDTVGARTGATLATLAAVIAQGGTFLFESKDGVVIRATSPTAAIADTDTIAGTFEYVID